MPGPATFATGLVDEAMFQNPSAAVRTQWLARARRIHSTWIRLRANWFLIAPTDRPRGFQPSNPRSEGYDWTTLDASLRSAATARQNVILQLVAPPRWALGRHVPARTPPDTWRPNATAVGAFARALATRYSGRFPDPLFPGRRLPRVTHFQIWNEPNLPTYLSPQWTRRRDGSWAPASPSIYRRMLNAGYANIKAVQPHAVVLAAGTAPYGDPTGKGRMYPVVFTRELLCLHGSRLAPERCPRPAHLDGLDHHPYSLTPTLRARVTGDVSVPDIWRLTRILHAAQRRHRVLPRGPKSIWVTEIDWDSNPPDRHSRVSLAAQARYLALAFYELWHQRVGHVLWFLIRDAAYRNLTGAGLYFHSGRAKPAVAAFRFPFVALARGHGAVLLWGRAPHGGYVTVQRRRHGTWSRIARIRTTRGGVFYAHRTLGRHRLLRARQGATASEPFSAS